MNEREIVEGMEMLAKATGDNATREDAKPVASASDDDFNSFYENHFWKNTTNNEPYFYPSREDAYIIWQACEAQHGTINQALLNAAHILANFNAGEAHEDGTIPRKLEEWQACYAKLFTQLNEVVQESLKREAQHRQKVLDLTSYLGQCASWDSADLAQIINKHFGE